MAFLSWAQPHLRAGILVQDHAESFGGREEVVTQSPLCDQYGLPWHATDYTHEPKGTEGIASDSFETFIVSPGEIPTDSARMVVDVTNALLVEITKLRADLDAALIQLGAVIADRNLLRDQYARLTKHAYRVIDPPVQLSELRHLKREIEVLRQYGNKDCTAQADEALAEERKQA